MAYENEIKEIDNRIAKNKEILFTFTQKDIRDVKLQLEDLKFPKISADLSAQFLKDNGTLSQIDHLIEDLDRIKTTIKALAK